MTPTLDFARAAAEAFVVRMMPGDQARVGSFSDRVDVSPEFTGNRDVLLTNLREGLHIGNPTRLWDALDHTMTELAALGGRRVIVLLTDGVDTYSTTRATQIFERARSDELMIYAVHIRSRARPGVEALISAARNVIDDPRRSMPPGEDPSPARLPDRGRLLHDESDRRRERDVHAGGLRAASPGTCSAFPRRSSTGKSMPSTCASPTRP